MSVQGPDGSSDIDFELKAKAALDQIEDEARKMGLYIDEAHVMRAQTGELVFVVQFLLGDIAFTERVQFPDKAATNSMVETMEKQLQQDTFLDERERLRKVLESGDVFAALDEPDDLGH